MLAVASPGPSYIVTDSLVNVNRSRRLVGALDKPWFRQCSLANWKNGDL